MRSVLDQWARSHKRRKLKELRAKQPKITTREVNEAFVDMLCDQKVRNEVADAVADYTRARLKEGLLDELLGPVGTSAQAPQA